MASPRFGHIVLRTNQLAAMSAWYCAVLDARVVARNETMCFLTYDREHHRVALVDVGLLDLAARRDSAPGLAHVAFGLAGVEELLDVFSRLRAAGIVPTRAVNHSFTASLYYRDPDGNEIELYCDTDEPSWDLVLRESSQSWDPDALIRRRAVGATEQDLASALRSTR